MNVMRLWSVVFAGSLLLPGICYGDATAKSASGKTAADSRPAPAVEHADQPKPMAKPVFNSTERPARDHILALPQSTLKKPGLAPTPASNPQHRFSELNQMEEHRPAPVKFPAYIPPAAQKPQVYHAHSAAPATLGGAAKSLTKGATGLTGTGIHSHTYY